MNPQADPNQPSAQNTNSAPVTPSQTPEGQAVPTGTQAPSKNMSKKTKIIITVIVGAILLLGGSAAAYMFAYLPNTPENVLLQGLYNTTSQEETKSARVSGTLKLSGGDIPEQLGDIDVNLALAENGDSSIALSTDFAGNTVSAEFRTLEENQSYIKLNGLKNVDKIAEAFNVTDPNTNQVIEAFSPLLSSLDDQWVELDQASEQVTGGATDTLDVLDLSQDDGDRVAEIYQDNPVLQIKDVLEDEEIDGQDSHHYQLEINKDNYVAFLSELKDANIDGVTVEQSDIDSAKDADLSTIKNIEVWIKKNDKTINQVLFAGQDKETNFELRLAVKDFNKEIDIEKPEDAEKFEQIIAGFLGTTPGGSAPAL